MRITGVEIVPVKLPLLEPFVVSYGTFPDLATVLVRVETDGGLTGWGEGTPDPHVTGETFEGVLATLRNLAPALLGRDPLDRSTAMRLLGSRVAGAPTAKAALDIALHDLVGRAAGLPVWALLGGRARETLSISRVISLKSPEEMAIAGGVLWLVSPSPNAQSRDTPGSIRWTPSATSSRLGVEISGRF